MSNETSIVWLRNDLRVQDNAALKAGLQSGASLVVLYIWDETAYGEWQPGSASKVWLHHALKSLQTKLQEYGGRIILKVGATAEVLHTVIDATGANQIFWNRRYEPKLRSLDADLKLALRAEGLKVETFNSALLNEPHTVANKSGGPFKVYSPYFKSIQDRPVVAPIEVNLENALWSDANLESEALAELNLLPSQNWWRDMIKDWDISESGAHERLNRFLDGAVSHYNEDRNIPGIEGSSKLSPYLQSGLIGPRQVVAALEARTNLKEKGPFVYLKEIYWREFAYNVLFHFPHTPEKPLQAQYADFPWEADDDLLKCWKKGQTGYPIVDAGMRELYATGWMHNRVRMIVASLLVKQLLQDWKTGAAWFWDTLVDADIASNTLGWQWSGGCGADAAPYFRVFNPMIQGGKFDPIGTYVKRYVPELGKLPAKYIHTPWEAPEAVLEAAGIELGVTYPHPIIDHQTGRERALSAFDKFKNPVEAI
ncbi:MAG: Deoxyribodipyrimidine photo-lyase [Opitutia bacterium UBA7350]|nr:MAG: Deoxyribodipyrimidine photo-lyase [Opitutae bacterium UBA7350]